MNLGKMNTLVMFGAPPYRKTAAEFPCVNEIASRKSNIGVEARILGCHGTG